MLGEYLRDPAVRRGRLMMACYLVFAVAMTGFNHWAVWYDKELGEAIVPLTGWSGLGVYLWTLFFAAMAIFLPSRSSFSGVIFMLGVCTAIEALDCVRGMMGLLAGRPNFDNPYLTYDARRPLVTVLPPLLWMAVLWLARRPLPETPPCRAGTCGSEAKAPG